MNRYFEALAAPVLRYGGTVDKYIGDCLMAVFGVPTAHENDAERACRAALEMLEAAKNLAHQASTSGERPMTLHMGLNSGLVVAAPVGSAGTSQFTVMGDTVNLASRLLHEAGEGEIVVGESTWAQVKDLYEFAPKMLRAIKGKSEKVAIYLLRGWARKPGLELKRPELALVGRARECARAEVLLAEAAARRGSLLYVTGEPGIGKSRLVEEVGAAAKERGFRVLSAAGQPFESLQPYGLWREILAEAADADAEADSTVLERALALGLETQPALAKHAPALRATFGLPSPEFELLDEDTRSRRIATAWKAAIHTLQTSQPLFLVLDDLQWADELSLQLANTLGDSLPGLAVLMCCAARPEFQPPWAGRPFYHEIVLRSLSAEESAALAREVSAGQKLDASAEHWAISRAEGNPFYLAELVRAAAERGTTDLPPTIQGIIMARVDRLEARAREVLEVASVIGREFPERVLRAVAHVEDLETRLRHLEQLEFLYAKQILPEMEYLFKHYLTQDTTYNSILIERRKQLHRQVAGAIEAIYKESLHQYYALLAQHLEKAGDYGKAFEYYRLAGERAQQTQSDTAAVALYQRGETALEKLYESRTGLRDKLKGLGIFAAAGLLGGILGGVLTALSERKGLMNWAVGGWTLVGVLIAVLLILLVGILWIKMWSFLVYPDRLRIRGKRRTIEIPFDEMESAELIQYFHLPPLPSLPSSIWKEATISMNPRYPKLGEAQTFKTAGRGWRRYIKIKGRARGWRRGYILDMDDPQRFLETLHRALARYRAVKGLPGGAGSPAKMPEAGGLPGN